MAAILPSPAPGGMPFAAAAPAALDESHCTNDTAWSSQALDADADGKADLAVLFKYKVDLYYSSKRNPGTLPVGQPSESLSLTTKPGCIGNGVRVGDFDLDGAQDILVVCREPGQSRLFAGAVGEAKWTEIDGIPLGALSDLKLAGSATLKDEPRQELVFDGPTLPAGAAESSNVLPTMASSFIEMELESFLEMGLEVGAPPRKKGAQHGAAAARAHGDGEEDGDSGGPENFGVSLIDLNNDGFLDVALAYKNRGKQLIMANQYKKVLEAAGEPEHRYLKVQLVGTKSNPHAIGATVLLECSGMGADGKTVLQMREMNSASHETDWWGTRDDRLIFGLGSAGTPTKLTVRWPGEDGKEQVMTELSQYVNTMLKVTEQFSA